MDIKVHSQLGYQKKECLILKRLDDNFGFFFLFASLGEIVVKRARGAKVKVLFQGLHMTHVIFVLVYNLKFYILDTPFNIAF